MKRQKMKKNKILNGNLAIKFTFGAFRNGVLRLRFKLSAVFKFAFQDCSVCIRIIVPLFATCMENKKAIVNMF